MKCLSPAIIIMMSMAVWGCSGEPQAPPAPTALIVSGFSGLETEPASPPSYHQPRVWWRAWHPRLVDLTAYLDQRDFTRTECLACHEPETSCNPCHDYIGVRGIEPITNRLISGDPPS